MADKRLIKRVRGRLAIEEGAVAAGGAPPPPPNHSSGGYPSLWAREWNTAGVAAAVAPLPASGGPSGGSGWPSAAEGGWAGGLGRPDGPGVRLPSGLGKRRAIRQADPGEAYRGFF